jgi:diacylglycerol kinase (ATP)
MRALLVANPRAGVSRGHAAPAEIVRRLHAAGMDVHMVEAAGPDLVAPALRDALRGESPERVRVIVAGGDGTIHGALPALAETEFPMAVLPVGSVNVLARELGIPAGLDDAIAVARTGELRRIDLGMANGRPFALMAGMGFDAAVVHSVAPDVKNLVGSFAYVARGLRVLATYPLSAFRITTEEETIEIDAWLAVVANASRYTYSWRLAPDARIDDGYLNLCLFHTRSPVQTAGQVAATLLGRHGTYPGVFHVRARELRFECQPPVCVQLDGDPAGETPVELRVAPGALTVVTPADP